MRHGVSIIKGVRGHALQVKGRGANRQWLVSTVTGLGIICQNLRVTKLRSIERRARVKVSRAVNCMK